MSIEIEVYPMRSEPLSVFQVQQTMRELATSRRDLKFSDDDTLLVEVGPRTPYIEAKKLYCVPFGCRSLTLDVHRIEEDPREHFVNCASNLSGSVLSLYLEKAPTIREFFNIDSKMGRGDNEESMMLLLAASIARLTDGLIILEDHPVLNVERGGYLWNEIIAKFNSYDGTSIDPSVKRQLE